MTHRWKYEDSPIRYLTREGIDKARIVTEAKGKRQPIATNTTEEDG